MDYTSYPAQRVLGLPSETLLYSGPGTTLVAKTTYAYDETGTFIDSNGAVAPYFIDESGAGVVQHDNATYHGTFTQRGNQTSVTQYSVTGGVASSPRIISRTSYDTNGNVRGATDGAGNRAQFVLTDNFSNKPVTVGQTHAYVYTAQNPIGFRAGSQYNYFTGQLIKSFNLLPGSSTEEQVVTTSYDFADRPLQTNRPDGGYVRTGYWDNFLNLSTAQQIAVGQVRFKFEEYDGAGRVRRKGADHPGAVAGKYSGQQFMFDQLGQRSDASNVIAMNGDWTPADEDAPPTGLGWIYTNKTYDEHGRVTLLTKPDNSTVQYQYDSCGCAGGSVTRIDELGCIRRTKADFLGRLIESSENPNPDDLSYVYTKAVYSYDVLDRLVTIERYNSGWSPTKKQTRSFVYDGYGRLQSETTPEGGTVSYTYTANDLAQTRLDQRGMVATSTYNTRNLVTGISYNDGGATPSVSFQYDDYGSRSQMTDGEGTTVYTYNAYRQLESERRTFTGLVGHSYTLSYVYNQADQMTRVSYTAANSGGHNLWPAKGQQLAQQPVTPAAAAIPGHAACNSSSELPLPRLDWAADSSTRSPLSGNERCHHDLLQLR
jgi:YD repeat-containing protein